MRFVQLATFYDGYLAQFYAERPELASKSHNEQIEALLQDGFGGAHLFAAHLGKLGYDTHLFITNCVQSQVAWARENGFYDVDERNWVFQIARAQLNALQPDIVYMTDPLTFESNFIRSLARRPEFVCGWRSAAFPEGVDFKEYDLILSTDVVSKEKALKAGARSVEHFIPAIPEFLVEKLKNEPVLYDFVFVGQWSAEHSRRNEHLHHVARHALMPGSNIKPAYFLSCDPRELPPEVAAFNGGSRWGYSMLRTIRHGKIGFHLSIDLGNKQAGGMRMFETTAAGALFMVEDDPTVKNYFEPGVEVATFTSKEDLIERIHYYLDHPQEREEVAARGHARCMRDHSMSTRCRDLDQMLRYYMRVRGSPRPPQVMLMPDLAPHQAAPVEPVSVQPVPVIEPAREEVIAEAKAAVIEVSAPTPAPQPPAEPAGAAQPLEQAFPDVSFGKSVQVIGIRNISIGAGSCVGDDAWLNVAMRDDSLRMRIGDSVLIGRQSVISTGGFLEIGDFCVLAPRVFVSDVDHGFQDIGCPVLMQPVTTGRQIIVEENCWLAINSVLTGNITIGRGSVVGANSVVNKDVPPFCVVAGNPARIIKMYNPRSAQWERCDKGELSFKTIMAARAAFPLPGREEYRQLLKQRAPSLVIDPIVAGRGVCI